VVPRLPVSGRNRRHIQGSQRGRNRGTRRRLPSHRPEALPDHWQIAAARHHRALDDVRATAERLHRLVAVAEQRGIAVGE